MISKKHNTVFRALNYVEHLLILAYAVAGSISISCFTSLAGIPVGITSSTVGLKIYATIVGTKNYISIIKKKRKKHDKIVLSVKINQIVQKSQFLKLQSIDISIMINLF